MILDITNFPDGLKKLVREEVERQRINPPNSKSILRHPLPENTFHFSGVYSVKGWPKYWEWIDLGDLSPYYGVRVVNVKYKNV